MSSEDVDDQFFTYEGRLASFQKTNKKRGSTATGRGSKALSWPHKQIAPASLAQAGFFFNPAPENPDNVTCFLCHKGLDGWEPGDDPLLEHLKHSGHCGWAIVSAIEANVNGYGQEDPNQAYMLEARKATFAGRWPHDGKRGWKCKTKQLVDAGWTYNPSNDSDDMATCPHCGLALDGWEQNDKPYDEHYNRAPNCAFFTLSSQFQTAKKRAGRGKAARTSKASRLSTQSAATTASDLHSIAETTMAPEDSILTAVTTASTMTAGGKRPRAKKSTAPRTKGKKSKAKVEDAKDFEDPVTTAQEASSSPPRKQTRGRKRGSDAVDESTLTAAGARPAKRRNSKGLGEDTAQSTHLVTDSSEMIDGPMTMVQSGVKKDLAPSKGRKSSRSCASTASQLPLTVAAEEFPDDDEIERQLQADLERQWSEDEISADPETNRANLRRKASESGSRASKIEGQSVDFAMFDPAPVEANDAAVEDELKALQAEMAMDEPMFSKNEELHVPKKGRKLGVRKASKNARVNRAKSPSPDPLEEDAPPVKTVRSASHGEPEFSIGSTDTVMRREVSGRANDGRYGRDRPSKASEGLQNSQTALDLSPVVEASTRRGRGRPPKNSQGNSKLKSLASSISQNAQSGMPDELIEDPDLSRKEVESERPEKAETQTSTNEPELEPVAVAEVVAPRRKSSAFHAAEDKEESWVRKGKPQDAQQLQYTPGSTISPAPSAKQAAISPSQSPQASDAENQPPSILQGSNDGKTKRVALAPISDTPVRSSPSKRNVMAGLQSSTPWTAIDLDAVLGSPSSGADQENAVDRILKRAPGLTSPEKQMTVEEWIYFNAGEAEKTLKHECETMVSRFESQGTRAMEVLEGLVIE